ncbi:hypothetical protein SETIT_9G137700v2 [Setaria italica]|uniref:Uncharacterized protein n=1 Tax=Setaria italica TaxID=4555 RepID=A0A368SG90_SETIT|nr:hypothetical protein SETIT_9G137700v2 [Setaria italica]
MFFSLSIVRKQSILILCVHVSCGWLQSHTISLSRHLIRTKRIRSNGLYRNIGKWKMHEYTATHKHSAKCPKPIARSTRLHALAMLQLRQHHHHRPPPPPAPPAPPPMPPLPPTTTSTPPRRRGSEEGPGAAGSGEGRAGTTGSAGEGGGGAGVRRRPFPPLDPRPPPGSGRLRSTLPSSRPNLTDGGGREGGLPPRPPDVTGGERGREGAPPAGEGGEGAPPGRERKGWRRDAARRRRGRGGAPPAGEGGEGRRLRWRGRGRGAAGREREGKGGTWVRGGVRRVGDWVRVGGSGGAGVNVAGRPGGVPWCGVCRV